MAKIINCGERERADLLEMCVPCSTRLAAAFGRNSNYDLLTVAELREQFSCDIVRQQGEMLAAEEEKREIIDNRVQMNNMNEPRTELGQPTGEPSGFDSRAYVNPIVVLGADSPAAEAAAVAAAASVVAEEAAVLAESNKS